MTPADYRQLVEHYRAYKQRGVQLVLVTVVETIGSTYRKAGAHMLISDEGASHGLVSGGCLEGNLLMHAQRVLQTGKPTLVEYDLMNEDEGPWGLSIGCNGIVRLVLQQVDPTDSNNLIEQLVRVAEGDQPAWLAVCAEGDIGQWCLIAESENLPVAGLGQSTGMQEAADGSRWMVQKLKPLPRILVVGAGPDVPPLLQQMHRQGWRVTVADHRPAYLQRMAVQPTEHADLVEVGQLAKRLELNQFDAAILMSHHLEADRAGLADLLGSTVSYIGMLGPRARAQQLLENLGAEPLDQQPRVHAPVGLDLGGEGAEAIALSIVAQLLCFFSHS